MGSKLENKIMYKTIRKDGFINQKHRHILQFVYLKMVLLKIHIKGIVYSFYDCRRKGLNLRE
jgi:hypothetical protein